MPQIGKYTEEDIDKLPKTTSDVVKQITPQPVADVAKTISSNLPSGQTAFSTGVGTAAGLLTSAITENPTLGSFTGSTAAALADLLQDPERQKRTTGENLLKLAKGSLYNEMFGRAFSGVGKVGAEAISPGSVTSEEFNSLLPFKPTYAQLTGSRIAKLVENTFAGAKKENALKVSSDIIKDQGTAFIQDQAGDPTINLTTPVKQALNIKSDLEDAFYKSINESNKRGTAATLIAGANRKIIPTYGLDPTTNVVSRTGDREVVGGIVPTNYFAAASDLLKKVNTSVVAPDPNGPLLKTLNNIVARNKELDASGNVVPAERNFADLWQEKQDIDKIAYGDLKTDVNLRDTRFKELSNAINKDIDNSIKTWPQSGQLAQTLWQESKAIVQKRNQLFLNSPIEKSINELNSPINAIDNIIKDPTVLKKAIISGNLQIPDQGSFKYVTNNTRKDLASYEITNLLNNSKTQDGIYDGGKLMQNLLDPNKQESYRILFGSSKNPQSTRANLETFFKNVSKVQDTDQKGMTRYAMLRLGATGLGITGGLLTGVTSSVPGGAAIIGGTLGLSAIGKLMTNTTVAPIMAKLASGEALGMPIQIAGRMIAEVLKNTPIQLYDKDGNVIDGKIGKDRKFEISVGR